MLGGSINWLLLIATAIANLGMGLYVFGRAPRSSLNRAFGLLALATSLWSGSLAVGYHVDPQTTGLSATTLVIRIAFAAGSLFAVAFLLFTERFALSPPAVCRMVRFFLVPVGIAFFVVSFSPWMVAVAK